MFMTLDRIFNDEGLEKNSALLTVTYLTTQWMDKKEQTKEIDSNILSSAPEDSRLYMIIPNSKKIDWRNNFSADVDIQVQYFK